LRLRIEIYSNAGTTLLSRGGQPPSADGGTRALLILASAVKDSVGWLLFPLAGLPHRRRADNAHYVKSSFGWPLLTQPRR
jgi:hypothetical protein